MKSSKSFRESVALDAPDPALSPILKSLWYDAKGDWKRAHDFVDQLPGSDAAWVHAYLHRKEGDTWNADYWYERAKKTRPACSFEEEGESLVAHFAN
jgi:hypothetical protein